MEVLTNHKKYGYIGLAGQQIDPKIKHKKERTDGYETLKNYLSFVQLIL